MQNARPARVTLSVWSDYVCPFCYLELPVLERLEAELGDQVEVRWHAFELRPDPVPTLDPDGEYLHSVWNASVYPMAERREMTLRLPPVQPRSRRALEAAEFAREQGRFREMNLALFRAFFEQGLDLDDVAVLVRVGGEVGLDGGELRAALEEGRFTERVLADQHRAQQLGIGGVPALLVAPEGAPLEEAQLVSGAQPYELVRAAVQRALAGETPGAAAGPKFRRGLPTLQDNRR